MNGHLEREQPQLGDLLTIDINHLLNGMILQVANHFFPITSIPQCPRKPG